MSLPMVSAIYYPHTEIQQKSLIKQALFLWDSVDFIVPFKDFSWNYRDREIAEAVEMIGRKCVPTPIEKRRIHLGVEDLITGRFPDSFYYKDDIDRREGDSFFFAEKLLPETWRMLVDMKIVRQRRDENFDLERNAALSLMSIVADQCAGTTKVRITDQGNAYAQLTNLLLGEPVETVAPHERIVPIALRTVGLSNLSLSQLIEFRKRERGADGRAITRLRHDFIKVLNSHVSLMEKAQSARDCEEIERRFELEMNGQLDLLKHALRDAKIDIVLTREFITTVFAAAGTFLSVSHGLPFEVPGILTAVGAPVTVGGALASYGKYARAVKAAHKDNPMAYLYQLSKQKF